MTCAMRKTPDRAKASARLMSPFPLFTGTWLRVKITTFPTGQHRTTHSRPDYPRDPVDSNCRTADGGDAID